MKIIVDSGSTKADWACIERLKEKKVFRTMGYNPHYVDKTYIVRSLRVQLPKELDKKGVEEIYFYGAGCTAGKSIVVRDALEEVFPAAHISIFVDLLGAARALLGREAGFAAILGTGTNSCIYDGRKISHNIVPLGFLLGDEGSGSYIGKRLLKNYLRGFMPTAAKRRFEIKYNMTFNEIMDNIYNQPLPNRFCASFAKLAKENIDMPYFYQLVEDSFNTFFEQLVVKYPNYQKYSFNCLGSIGYNFSEILEKICEEFGMQFGQIVKSPIEGLIQFHQNKQR